MKADNAIVDFLEQGISEQIYSCGFLLVLKGHEVLCSQGVGKVPVTGERPNATTRFDLASLTKVVATLPAVLVLIETKQLSLEQTVGEVLVPLQTSEVGQITIKQLLTHTSGLPAHIRFYEQTQSDILLAIKTVTLETVPGTAVNYSDLGFMLLGKIVEKISGQSLGAFSKAVVFQNIGMTATSFGAQDAVATRTVNQPDDKNARYLDGDSGHAGLFSTATDLSRYLLFWQRIIKQSALYQAAITCQVKKTDDPRGFGWVLKNSSFSFFDNFSELSFGHTGYTGTSIMVDPTATVSVVFLTNRVYYATDMRFIQFRKQLHTLIKDWVS